SVGPEEAEHLARGGGEGHAVHRVDRRLGIPLDEIDDLDREPRTLLGNNVTRHREIVGTAPDPARRIAVCCKNAAKSRMVRHTGAMRRGVWLLGIGVVLAALGAASAYAADTTTTTSTTTTTTTTTPTTPTTTHTSPTTHRAPHTEPPAP